MKGVDGELSPIHSPHASPMMSFACPHHSKPLEHYVTMGEQEHGG